MSRYFIAVAVLLLSVFLPIVAAGVQGSFIDLPMIILTLVLPIMFVSILLGFKKTATAFTEPMKKEPVKANLLMAKHYFKTLHKVVWMCALIATMDGAIQMLDVIPIDSQTLVARLDTSVSAEGIDTDVSTDGQSTAVLAEGLGILTAGIALCILPLFYSMILTLIVAMPFKAIVKKRLNEIQ